MSSMQLRRSVMSFVLVFILSIIGFVAQANEINVIQLDSFPARTQVTIEFQVQLPETLPPNVTRFGTQVRLGVAQLATTLSDDPDTIDLVSDPTFSPLQFNLAVSQLPDTGESPLWRTILILVGAGALIIGLTLISLRLRRLLVVALLAASVILSLVFITSAQESSNSLTAILIDDFLCNDINDDGFAGPNEIICYTLILRNLGDTALNQINGELIDLSFDGNISIVPDSIEIGAFLPLDPNVNETEANAPAEDNETENNTPTPPIDADAGDDAFTVTNGASSTNDVLANDEGDTPLNVLSFGDSLANVGTIPADGVTELVLVAGGGTVNITIDASGNINIDATTATSTGSVSLFYEIEAGNNTTDIGQVDISYGDFPSATDDTLATLGLLNIYVTDVGVTLNVGAGTGVMNNDTLGTPAATLVNWGGGDASPSANLLPSSSLSFAGGTLTVNADGSFDLINPTSAGVFTFDYILENTVGTSQATVEIYVAEVPTAIDDNYEVSLGSVDSSNNITDNDDLGTPPAEVDFYADENDIGGTSQVASPVTYTHPTGNFTVTIDSAGNLTVDASVGGIVEGSYSFDYQLTNSAGSSTPSGTVTVDIVSTPTTQDDDFTVILPNNLSGDLTANNGNGPDTAGVPAFTSLTFGDGSLTGTFTGGDSVGLAGGTLTVNNDGTITLNGATTTGTYTFDYQLTNANGSSNSSTVTIEVQQAPSAVADALTASVGIVNNYPASTLFNDNGSGSDDLGVPIATIVNFGGGSITGSTAVTDFAFNTTTGAGTFAGGTLTVNDDGSVVIDSPTTPGTVTFEYRTDNGVGFSDAIVTVNIVEGPIAENDLFGVKLGNDLIGADLLADNGNGVDQSGTPAFDLLTFGAGDLLGTITSNTATGSGTSVGLAGGTLTVRSDGTLDLVGATTVGTYTFDYRLESTSISQSDDATVTIVVDTPPTVTSTTPLDTATNVTTNTTIDITFSENVNITGDWITIVCGTSGTFNNTNGNIGVTPATGPASSFVVTPTGGFDPAGEDCTVTLNATLITDDDTHPAPTEPATSDQLDGNSDNTGGDNYTFSFTTADIAPQVTNAQVEQGNTLGALTTGIDNNTNIALTFSEQVNFGASAYNVTCTTSGDVTASYSASATPATSVTLTYGGTGLDSGETCTLTLESTLITDNDVIDPPNELDGDASSDTTDGDADDYTFNFTVDEVIQVNSITPANTATDIAIDSTVIITFSEIPTLNGSWFTIACDVSNVTTANSVVSGAGTSTISINPIADFDVGSTCTLTVLSSATNGVTDADAGDPPDLLDGDSDNIEGGNFTSTFTTADTAPQVTNTQVEQGNTLGALMTGIDNNTNIALTFSEQVNFGASAYNVSCTSSGDVTTSYSASATPATSVTLTYGGTGLDSGETCTLTLESTLITDTDVIDPPNELDGDASSDTTDGDADDYTFNFTVDTAPSITSIQVEKSDTLGDITTPSNDTDVDLDTTIVITFSETVTGSNDWVTLTCAPSSDTFNPTGSAGAGILGVAGNGTVTITLTPPANFTPNDTCTVTVVASEINDGDAGDPPAGLASDYSDTFTLVNQVAPTANDDAFSVALGSPLNLPAGTLFNDNSSGADDLGIPAATLVSFGGGNTTTPTDATDHPAGATDGLAGGTLQVNADGSLSLTGATTAGTYTFLYRLTNAAGSNDATVTVTIQTPPDGFDDSSTGVLGGTSAPSDAFHVAQNAPAANIANLYVDNGGFGTDELGVPSAPIDAPADVINTITLNGSPDAATGTIGGGAITIGVDGTISVATNGDLTFEPPTGFVGLATFDYTLANSIGTDATPATVTIAVGNRPACAVDAYTGTANINLSANVAAGVLANDTGDDITVTQSMGSAVNVGSAVATTNSGSVTLNADGSFDYSPPAGVSGVNVDSFTYAIDNSFGEVTTNCTVNITLNTDAGAIPWFIERGAVGTNNGTFANPFNSIASFNAANTNTGNNPGTGDVVYVYADVPGFYNEADGLNLLDAQKIYGGTVQFDSVFTASGLVSSAYTTFASTAEGARTEIRTTGDDAFDIFSNNIIQGFTIDSTAGYAFADSGVSIGTTTISDVSTFNNGGVFNLQNGGTLNATLSRMSASTTGSLSVIRLNGINGTITDTIAGGIIHNGSGNMFDIRNGTVSVTVSSPVTMLNTATGIGIFMSNADGTYNFLSNSVDIGSGSGGINIENGSDGTLNITNTGSRIQGIQGIPFRINNSAMNVDYNGTITHRQGTTPSALMTARVVEIIGGTGIISFDGNVIHGTNSAYGTAQTIFLSNTGAANTISFNYVDSTTNNTSVFFSNTSGNVAVNRLRSNCQGDLTIAGNTHCIQISDTTSSGFTIEALSVDTDDGGENGGAISLVNTPGIWTIEDISLDLNGRFQTLVFGNNFGTLNIATVNSGTSPGALVIGNFTSDNGGTIDLTNGMVNINVNNLNSFNSVDHGINLVDVDGPLFRASGNVVLGGLVGSNEAVLIQNVDITTIDIGTDGTTNNTVSVTDRRTYGISASRAALATTIARFGDLVIPNPHGVPENQINPTPVPTWLTFNSLTP